MNEDTRSALNGKRLGVFGKGGSGKSTITALMAHALQELGYDVCVLDADSTNVGLPQAMGLENPSRSLLDFYGGMVFSGGAVTCPVDDPTPLHNADISLDELPEEYYSSDQNGVTLLTAGKIGNLGPGAGCDGPVTKIARDLTMHSANKDLVTLIDFKAGFEDSARGAVTALDWALMVVDPTTASLEMAVNMQDMIRQIQEGVLPATEHLGSDGLVDLAQRIFTDAKIKDIHFMLNRVPEGDIEGYLRQKLADKGIQPLGVIHEDPSIPKAWLRGEPITTQKTLKEMKSIVAHLEEVANGGA